MLSSMAKRINYQLTDEQMEQLEQAIRHDPRPEVVRRATAVRLLHQGHKPEAVASMLAVSRASVQNWHCRWRADGLGGLVNAPIPGRPAKANATYQQALERDPHSLGYAFSVWTIERLAQHLETETGVRLSEGRLGAWLKRWGYGYRQPKTELAHKQDPAVRQQVQQWLDELKKQPNRGLAASSLWTKRP
jgi:transposase